MVSEWDPLCYGWHNGNNLKSLSGRNDRWQFRLHIHQFSCSRVWLVFIGNISMFITGHIPSITSMLLTHHHESELKALFHWFPMYLIWQIRKSHIPRSLWVCKLSLLSIREQNMQMQNSIQSLEHFLTSPVSLHINLYIRLKPCATSTHLLSFPYLQFIGLRHFELEPNLQTQRFFLKGLIYNVDVTTLH